MLSICILFYSAGAAQENRDTSINIYFATNSFDLDAVQQQKLKDFFSVFHNIKQIVAYADSTGEAAYNLSLCRKRAHTVFNALKEDIDALTTNIMLNKGESTAEQELWKNRRVVVTAWLETFRDTHEKPETNNNDTLRTFDVENIYFVPDKAIITQESLFYVQELAAQLKTYQTETFEIIGHVNYQSELDSTFLQGLYRLSEQRAKVVYTYLQEFGIPATRMTYKGVGNANPVFPSPTNDEQRRKNMRVQIIIRKQ